MPHRLLARGVTHATGRLGWLRGALGAAVGILFAGVAAGIAVAAGAGWPLLVAPLGASAVLVFAFPASPLAQPWPVLGGNLLSAAIGLACRHFIPAPELATALAVGTAIAAMSLARCLHPPGGACALLAALGTPAMASHGWQGLMLPLAANVLALLAVGWAWNNLSGHSWPHRPPATPPPPRTVPGAYALADLDHVLEQWDEVLDVSRDDLDLLIRAVERQTQRRHAGPERN